MLSHAIHTDIPLYPSGEQTASKDEVYQKFTALAQTHFIQRCPEVTQDTETTATQAVPELEPDQTLMYSVPSMEVEG